MDPKKLFNNRLSAYLLAGIKSLPDESLDEIRRFITKSLHPYGGFRGYHNSADLYYTTFGLYCATALKISANWEQTRDFLARYEEGEELDLVHLLCLVRCWKMLEFATNGAVKDPFPGPVLEKILEPFLAEEGGFNKGIGRQRGTIFETFLAVMALDEHGCKLPPKEDVTFIIQEMKTRWGGYANHRGLRIGVTSVTAAVITLLHRYGLHSQAQEAGQWILKQMHEKGGLKVNELSVIPDLTSTATALMAMDLLGLGYSEEWRQNTLDFIGSLWSGDGGFCGHIVDKRSDLEHTFYALIVLGILQGNTRQSAPLSTNH